MDAKTNLRMDSQVALGLVQQGATLLLLDVPQYTLVGIDTQMFSVGPVFKGIKMIPPGPHFVYYSSSNRDGNEFSPIVGFFIDACPSEAQSQVLSVEAKDAAAQIERRVQLGSKLSEVINSKEDALALFDLYKNDGYMLVEHNGRFCVILREDSSPQDMLKSLFQVNYLYWLEKNMGIESGSVAKDCRLGGRLQMSLDYVQREFNHVKHDGQLAGWVTDGLIARPLATRIRPSYATSSVIS